MRRENTIFAIRCDLSSSALQIHQISFRSNYESRLAKLLQEEKNVANLVAPQL